MQGKLNLLHVADEPTSDCGDPDCELHSPWVIEDESKRDTALAHYIAGAKSTAAQFEEFLQGDLKQYLDDLSQHAEQLKEAKSE